VLVVILLVRLVPEVLVDGGFVVVDVDGSSFIIVCSSMSIKVTWISVYKSLTRLIPYTSGGVISAYRGKTTSILRMLVYCVSLHLVGST
jgi:hypothetical protein